MRPLTEPATPGHLTDADIAASVHGDAGGGAEGTMSATARQAHLEGCTECRARLDEARRLDSAAAELLRAVDAPRLRFDAGDVIAAARRRASAPHRRHSLPLAMSLAAAVVMCAAGVVAFAFPTSPLGRWLRQIVTPVGVAAPWRTEPGPQTPVMGSADASASGVAVAPAGALTITFRGAIPAALRVRYCDRSLATLRVLSRTPSTGAALATTPGHVRFTVSRDRISVTAADPRQTFELTLPTSTDMVYVTDAAQHIVATLPLPPTASSMKGCGTPMTVPLVAP